MTAPSIKISQDTLQQLTVHLVFPRNLPSYWHEHETILARLMLDAVQDTHGIFPLPSSSIKLLQCFEKLHPLVDATAISTELQQLRPGEMIGLYVRKQNSCLVVYAPSVKPNSPSLKPNSPSRCIVSTFPVLLKKIEINNCDGDIQVKMILFLIFLDFYSHIFIKFT